MALSAQRTTLADALKDATENHWGHLRGGKSLTTFARACVSVLGEDFKVSSVDARVVSERLLKGLRAKGLSETSIRAYYGAFKRMCDLTQCGVSTRDWPKVRKPPRATRDAIGENDLDRLIERLPPATADLARILRGTGLRVGVEGLSPLALRFAPPSLGLGFGGVPYGTLHVTGKGGHQRIIPVVDPEAIRVLSDEQRLRKVQKLPYLTHLRHWKRALGELGLPDNLTPHTVRHMYARRALRLSAGNLSMVQELLGHASPATTAIYLETSLDDKANVLGRDLVGEGRGDAV